MIRLPEGSTLTVLEGDSSARLVSAWRDNRLGLLWLAALAPAFVAALLAHGLPFLINFIYVAITLQVWHVAFRQLHGKPSVLLSSSDLLHTCLLSLLLPLHLPLWQIAMTASFGYVFGYGLFGGRGFSFLNPVVVALSFHLYSYGIAIEQVPQSAAAFVWLLPGAIGLLLFELASMRTITGIALGALVVSLVMSIEVSWTPSSWSTVFLTVLFLAADPASGASTNSGRWMSGLLCGALLILLSLAKPDSLAPLIYAVFLTSLSVPLIDYLIVRIYSRKQALRND